ncbi:hypothetical protein [Lentilactobacillus kosonis]|uniref:hypothetical protein n=1 Tax=Lentilactobacillus kosonis TaxID=2810561 RepID=UPI000F61E52C|nr:hypothetical protein [Lentilactobacillus kosonis]
MIKYLDYAIRFLCLGLVTTFALQIAQSIDPAIDVYDSPLNYFATSLFIVPVIFFSFIYYLCLVGILGL